MNRSSRTPDAQESRGAVALTVAWMLTSMSTAAALAVVLIMRLLSLAFPAAAGGRSPLSAVAAMLLVVALATGLASVALTPLVLRVRRSRPPRAITIAAVLIGLAPLVLFSILALV